MHGVNRPRPLRSSPARRRARAWSETVGQLWDERSLLLNYTSYGLQDELWSAVALSPSLHTLFPWRFHRKDDSSVVFKVFIQSPKVSPQLWGKRWRSGPRYRRCVLWMTVQRVVTVLRDMRGRRASLWVEWEERVKLFWGCLRSYGRREMCCFRRRESDDAARMRGGDE